MLVTHDMRVIAETADTIVVTYAGRVVEVGAVGRVIRAPQRPYTAGLMASIPSRRARSAQLQKTEGAMPRLDAMLHDCAFHPRCPIAACAVRSKCRGPRVADGEVACWLHAGGTELG
ncbi:MAG: oligopeptide/dipeptide ABC transporter ATP-binding protein [Acetobacteraceae bacterium]